MKIIIGLGNPGAQYQLTPHNIGFEVADELARRWSESFAASRRERSDLLQSRCHGMPVVLAKPMTFMNLSGQAAALIFKNRPAEPEDLLTISDDADLDIGRLRLRGSGGHGGHNGLRSIIEGLGTDEFARLRIGVRPPRPIDDLAQYVLRTPHPEDRDRLSSMVEIAADAAECWLSDGIEEARNAFNGYRDIPED